MRLWVRQEYSRGTHGVLGEYSPSWPLPPGAPACPAVPSTPSRPTTPTAPVLKPAAAAIIDRHCRDSRNCSECRDCSACRHNEVSQQIAQELPMRRGYSECSQGTHRVLCGALTTPSGMPVRAGPAGLPITTCKLHTDRSRGTHGVLTGCSRGAQAVLAIQHANRPLPTHARWHTPKHLKHTHDGGRRTHPAFHGRRCRYSWGTHGVLQPGCARTRFASVAVAAVRTVGAVAAGGTCRHGPPRACVRVCARACVCVCVCVRECQGHVPGPPGVPGLPSMPSSPAIGRQSGTQTQPARKQTNKQIAQANQQTNIHTIKQANKQASKQTNKQTNKQASKQTKEKTDNTQTNRRI